MYPQQQQPVRRQAQGILAQVEPRQGGWMRFHVMEPGNQYPTKIDTSLPQLIEQMMSLMGQPVAVEYTESASDAINQRSGKPFINRRLEAVAPGSAPAPQQYQQQVQPQQPWQQLPGQLQQPQSLPQSPQAPQQAPMASQTPSVRPGMMGAEKDLNICRQCASKVVGAMLMAGVIPEEDQSMAGLVEAAEAWMSYYMYGSLPFGVRPFSQPAQPVAPQQHNVPVQQNGEPEWVTADPGRQQGDPGPQ